MKPPRFIRILSRLVCSGGLLATAAFAQTTACWVVNGATADGVWSTSAASHADFSDGTEVAGASTITIKGIQVVSNITADEGAVTLAGALVRRAAV